MCLPMTGTLLFTKSISSKSQLRLTIVKEDKNILNFEVVAFVNKEYRNLFQVTVSNIIDQYVVHLESLDITPAKRSSATEVNPFKGSEEPPDKTFRKLCRL